MKLPEFFKENKKAAIAFSGGTDSVYLLYEAIRSGADIRAYYVKTAFQPQFEFEDALRAAELLHADIKILETDILSQPLVAENSEKRCYYCKKTLMSLIIREAEKDGYGLCLDGTNASDSADDRPGMAALHELKVRSPLRECGLTKPEIRRLSEQAGLFTWNKPAYACLATRIPAGTALTQEMLAGTEAAETYLFFLGIRDFRVRRVGNAAKIQVPEAQLELILENRVKILEEFKKYYSSVLLDLNPRE